MNNNNPTAKVQVTNAHGRFEADAEVLSRAIFKVGAASIDLLRHEAAGACGFTPNPITGTFHDFDDLTRVEVLIAWIDSGNHNF